MNPLFVIPILVYTIVATALPNQIDSGRRGRDLLIVEGLLVAATLGLGLLLAPLASPSPIGFALGRAGLLAAAYTYACGRGVVLIRAVLELRSLHMRRDEDRSTGAIDVARGRMIGFLERALALTLIFVGEYAAIGLIIAAKSLARFKALDNREFAEYFLVGTLASLLLAVLVGVAVRLLL